MRPDVESRCAEVVRVVAKKLFLILITGPTSSGADLQGNIPLKAGDVILVPERGIFE